MIAPLRISTPLSRGTVPVAPVRHGPGSAPAGLKGASEAAPPADYSRCLDGTSSTELLRVDTDETFETASAESGEGRLLSECKPLPGLGKGSMLVK